MASLNYQNINNLIDRVESGDEEAIQEARRISVTLSKRANVRLKALEDQGLTAGEAYANARDFAGSGRKEKVRFSQSAKLDEKALVKNLEEVSAFLADPYSTITVERFRISGFESETYTKQILPIDASNYQKRELQAFLKSSAWKEYKSTIYVHEHTKTPVESRKASAAIAAAGEAIASGAKVKELKRVYEDFEARRKDPKEKVSEGILDIIEDWEEF